MLLRLVQTAEMAPGTAELHCGDCSFDHASVEFCISRLNATGQENLDPSGADQPGGRPWGSAEFWQQPDAVEQRGSQLVLRLNVFSTFHLAPNTPYLVSLRDHTTPKRSARLIGIPLRLPSAPPRGWRPPVALSRVPSPAEEPPIVLPPAPPTEAAATDHVPILSAHREMDSKVAPASAARGRRRLLFAAAAFALLVLTAGTAWWLTHETIDPMPPSPAPTTTAEARAFILKNPSPEEARIEGERHLAAKSLDGAFLLFRYAAERGDAAAAVAVGTLYDPGFWTKEKSPFPASNADVAAEWYKRAADVGDAEAQFRLGALLKSGRTQAPDGPERGVFWLSKAAAQGHDKAKEALRQ